MRTRTLTKATLALACVALLCAAANALAGVIQEGNVRVAVNGNLSPHRLPREGAAPIAVSVGGTIATVDGSLPPQLKTISVEINRNGRFDTTGLPLCPIAKIQPASTHRALSNCRAALVGKGSFSALIGLGEQERYETEGQLLLFNAEQHNKPVLYGQIYAAHPFASSFVIPFAVKRISKGPFGTLLFAKLPASLRSWGNLTGIQMRLSRRFGYQGEQRSYVSSGCPAPKGFGQVLFPLARTTFAFEGGTEMGTTLTDTCRVR
jgi:hypothetical protein